MRYLYILLFINYTLAFNLYSIIYPIKHSFHNLDNKWNWNYRLFPLKESNYIGNWYYYYNIDFIKTHNDIIGNPVYWKNNIVLSNYVCKSNKIKSTKIINNSLPLPPYYKKILRSYDNNKQYYKSEHLYSNRIIKLKHTNIFDKLHKNANILRTIVVRPNYSSITCTPYIPNNSLVKELLDKSNINNTNYTISFNIWLTEPYVYDNAVRTGVHLSYDGINGNLKEFILKKDNLFNKSINIDSKINLTKLYKSNDVLRQHHKENVTTDIKDFDNYTTINYIILKNNWEGNYRIQSIFNNTHHNQITWSSDHRYFIPISNNDIYKYYQLKFDDGIYVNIPKNIHNFKDDDKIYIEFVCFFKNASGIQRFIAWGSKSDGGIKTFCHDIWNKKSLLILD